MAKRERRDPLRNSQEPVDEVPAVLANKPRAAGARNRTWEKQHKVVAYRGIPPLVQSRIKNLAEELGVNAGEVARYLLEYSLAAYDQGNLTFPAPRPKDKFTLYE